MFHSHGESASDERAVSSDDKRVHSVSMPTACETNPTKVKAESSARGTLKPSDTPVEKSTKKSESYKTASLSMNPTARRTAKP